MSQMGKTNCRRASGKATNRVKHTRKGTTGYSKSKCREATNDKNTHETKEGEGKLLVEAGGIEFLTFLTGTRFIYPA